MVEKEGSGFLASSAPVNGRCPLSYRGEVTFWNTCNTLRAVMSPQQVRVKILKHLDKCIRNECVSTALIDNKHTVKINCSNNYSIKTLYAEQ